MRLVLASQSPRRLELLTRVGLVPEVLVSGVEEITRETEPQRVVMDLSRQKAEGACALLREKEGRVEVPDTYIIGADTVVCVDGTILGKPHSHEEAEGMIRLIAGRTHQVYSGVTIIAPFEGKQESFTEKTDVTVYPMSDQEIHDYAFSREPMDKAGSYGIQGFFGRYIEKIDGDYSNVVGLPAGAVYQHLKTFLH